METIREELTGLAETFEKLHEKLGEWPTYIGLPLIPYLIALFEKRFRYPGTKLRFWPMRSDYVRINYVMQNLNDELVESL